jgi:type I thyroxine 5'-deiodinase
MESNREEKLVFKQPVTFDQRRDLAKILVERLKYRMPVAIDAMDGRAEKAFAAWPERIYVLEKGGRVLFKGDMGPFGFHPEQAEKTLASMTP